MSKNKSQKESKSSEVLETIVRWGVYATAFLPLIIFKQFISPFHFGKVVLFRSWIEIIAVIFVALILLDRSYLPKRSIINWVLLAFGAVFLFSTLTSVNMYQSFWGTLERMGGFFSFAHFLVFFIIITSVFRKKEHWYDLMRLSVVISATSLVYGLFQKIPCDDGTFLRWFQEISIGRFNGEPIKYLCEHVLGSGQEMGRARIFGTIGNPALFAGYTLMNAFFALLLMVRSRVLEIRKVSLFATIGIAVFLMFLMIHLEAPVVPADLQNSDTVCVGFTGSAVQTGKIFQSIIYGILALVAGVFSIKAIERYLYGIVVVASGVAIYSTVVRGSVLAIIAATIVMTLMVVLSKKRRVFTKPVRITVLVITSLLLIFQATIMFSKDTDFVKDHSILLRLSDIELNSPTVQTRIRAWRAGVDGWNDNVKTLLVGWGPENFNVPFSVHFNPEFYQGPGSETLFDRAHNMFVEILATMGLLGISSYVAIFVALGVMLKRLYARAREPDEVLLILVLVGALVAHVVHNTFFFGTSADFLVFFIYAGFVSFLYQGIQNVHHDELSGPLVSRTMRYSILMILSLGVIWLIYSTTIIPARANYTTTRAMIGDARGQDSCAVREFKKAIEYDTFGVYESRTKYAQFVVASAAGFGDELDGGAELLNVIEEQKKNIVNSDLNHIPYLYISSAYTRLGQGKPESEFNIFALQASLKALEISPNFIRTYYEVAQAYMNMNKYDAAVEILESAINLNPDVGISWWYLGLAQTGNGKHEEALESIARAASSDNNKKYNYRGRDSDISRVIKIHAALGNFEEIVDLYQIILARNPRDVQSLASLATTYAELRQYDKAVETLRKAVQIAPQFEDDARAFLRSIGRTL